MTMLQFRPGPFGHAALLAIMAVAGLWSASPAAAQTSDATTAASPVLLGVAAPLSDSQAILGTQLVAGARAAAGTVDQGAGIEIVEAGQLRIVARIAVADIVEGGSDRQAEAVLAAVGRARE